MSDSTGSYSVSGLQLLDSGNYIAVNRTLIQILGLHEAVIIGELASEAMLYDRENKLENGWFYITTEKLESKTSLSPHFQRKAIDKLCELGIVQVKYKGIPRKRFVKINFQQLLNIVENKSLTPLTTNNEPRLPLPVDTVNDNNNNEEQQPKQTLNICEKPKKSRTKKAFVPPTVEEVQAYINEKKYTFSAQHFVDYYEAGGWRLGNGKPVTSWKQCCATWGNNQKGGSNARPTKPSEQFVPEFTARYYVQDGSTPNLPFSDGTA